MEWGDFSCLVFPSPCACLQFPAFFLSFFPSVLPSFLPSFFLQHSLALFSSPWCLEVIQRSCQYRQVVQKPRGSFSIFSLASISNVLSLSTLFLSLSLSLLPGCLAGRTMLDHSVLSALCIWMALCARVGLQPGVRASAWVFVRIGLVCLCEFTRCEGISLLTNVIML